MTSRIKRADDARAIRRGIEYAKRENEAYDSGNFKGMALCMMQTDHYAKYLNSRAARLFRNAWYYTTTQHYFRLLKGKN